MWKWLAAFVVIIAGAIVAWHFGHQSSGSKSLRATVLVISGDTTGWITPCGCTSNQSGGLLRRGTYLDGLSKDAAVIYADVGGAPAGVSPYQRLKFQAIAGGEIEMNIAAHNIGGPEARLGPAYLRDIAGRLHLPLISANARDASSTPIAPAYRIVQSEGRRVALIGVLSPRFATGEVLVADPRQAVVSTLGQIRGQFDFAIVLAYVADDELPQLASDLPEVDAVIGGPTGQAIAPKATAGPIVGAATNKGKFLVQLDIPAEKSARIAGKIVELTGTFADEAAQVANLHRYLTDLGQRDLPAADSGFAPTLPPATPADYRIAGSSSCTTCHTAESKSWVLTAHAHATATLLPRGFQVDPDCLKCHTTGYGLPGGFDSPVRSPQRTDVGCENCHGPSAAHVSDPKMHTPFVAADQCIRCHDHENSPQFDYPAYWMRVQHGRVHL